MDELYDWTTDEEDFRGSSPVTRQAPLVPRINLPPVYRYDSPPANAYHGHSCQCHECYPHQRAAVVNHPNAGAPILDKAIAFVVAMSGMVVAGLVMAPILIPLVGLAILMMVVLVVALALAMGVVWAVTGYRPQRPPRAPWR